jgi:AcrR family transcriptional regulator
MPTKTRRKPRRTARQRRSLDTVEAILEAAAQVFQSRGYAGGSTNHIAERAGVSIGTLYQYYPNKDAIVLELSRRHIAAAEELAWPALARLVERAPPLRQGLEEIVWGMIALHRQSPRLQQVLFEQAPGVEETQALARALSERASALIAAYLAKRSEVTAADPALAAGMVVEVVDAVTHRLVINAPPEVDAKRYADETVAMLEGYLTR